LLRHQKNLLLLQATNGVRVKLTRENGIDLVIILLNLQKKRKL